MRDRMSAAVEAGDLDELLRIIDLLCDRRDWRGLAELRERAHRALERGRQLWPAASHAEYRLALEAPGEYAASVLVEGAGRFALGPLAEVAASTHTWSELASRVSPGPVAALAAHERVLRGEDLTGTAVDYAGVLAVPLRLQPWEPAYPLAVYHADRAEFPGPDVPHGRPLVVASPEAAAAIDRVRDAGVEQALLDVVRAWTTGSEGRARVAGVRGDAAAAVGALGVGGSSVRAAPLSATEALEFLGWAGASGGAHGRRRGAAAGRDGAWAAVAALGGLAALDTFDPEAVGEAAERLAWLWWDAPDGSVGWTLRLAVEDPVAGTAWALDAVDRRGAGAAT